MLGFFALLSVGVSFADFQSEWNDCSKLLNASTCYEKVQKKYIVTKAKACAYKDDTITNKPLQTSRLQEKTLTTSFYKYNNKLFYQVAVSKDKKFTANKVRSYLYMYNCKTKKSYDMSKGIPKLFLHIWDIISADDEVIRLAQPIQFNKWKIFFQRELWWLAGQWYFLYDTVKSVFSELKIEKFKNYKTWAEKIIKNLPEGVGLSTPIISSVDKDFVGTVSFAGQTAKINLLTKVITLLQTSQDQTTSFVKFFLTLHPNDFDPNNIDQYFMEVIKPVQAPISSIQDKIFYALKELFSVNTFDYGESWASNYLYESDLSIDRDNVSYQNGKYIVNIEWNIVWIGSLANIFIKPQIKKTIEQYTSDYIITLNDSENEWICALDVSGNCN